MRRNLDVNTKRIDVNAKKMIDVNANKDSGQSKKD